MLGKKASIGELKKELLNYGIKSFYITEFVQGKTSRWGLAWTFVNISSTSHEKIIIDTVSRNMRILVTEEDVSILFNKIIESISDFCTITKKDSYSCKISVSCKMYTNSSGNTY